MKSSRPERDNRHGTSSTQQMIPGFGLGLVMSGAICVHDGMLLAASEALATQMKDEYYEKGLIFPPFSNIRAISANIAAKVASKVYELGLASRLPHPKNLVKFAESYMYKASRKKKPKDISK